MPKIRITMEVEIGDLASFWPNERVTEVDHRIAHQNIWDTLRRGQYAVIEERLALESETNKQVKQAAKQHLDDERKLYERIFNNPGGFRFEVLKKCEDKGARGCPKRSK